MLWRSIARAAPVFVASLLAFATPSRAADIFVTTTEDGIANDGDCTLREAILAANTNTAVDECAAGTTWPQDVIVLTAADEPYASNA